MPDEVNHRETCRLCDGVALELVLPIRPSPIADAYIPEERLGEKQDSYPLDLHLCLECGHLQHLDTVNPEVLFRNYIYVTSSSLGLVGHYEKYAGHVVERFSPEAGSLVVEIGSNDGSLLKFFRSKGLRVLGIDPAREIAEQATSAGVPTLPEFFTSALVPSIIQEHGNAAIVTANNVFAHADGLGDIVRGIRMLLADDGVFVFEVSYLVDIIDKFLFDTVYHEHVSYHSVTSLANFFQRFGMQLFDVQQIASKGGSIRGFVQKSPEGKKDIRPIVMELLDMEEERGMTRPEVFRKFYSDIEARKSELSRQLDELIDAGKTVAGYGASTTVTTLMYHFELVDKLSFLVDDNPRKQFTYSPGAHIPVLPSEELYTRRPDYVVVLAWQYAEPIVKKHDEYLRTGGRFIVPLPTVRVIDASAI